MRDKVIDLEIVVKRVGPVSWWEVCTTEESLYAVGNGLVWTLYGCVADG